MVAQHRACTPSMKESSSTSRIRGCRARAGASGDAARPCPTPCIETIPRSSDIARSDRVYCDAGWPCRALTALLLIRFLETAAFAEAFTDSCCGFRCTIQKRQRPKCDRTDSRCARVRLDGTASRSDGAAAGLPRGEATHPAANDRPLVPAPRASNRALLRVGANGPARRRPAPDRAAHSAGWCR